MKKKRMTLHLRLYNLLRQLTKIKTKKSFQPYEIGSRKAAANGPWAIFKEVAVMTVERPG